MIIGAAKLFFIVAGGAAAAAGTAYVTGALDPYLPGQRPPVAAVAPEPQPEGQSTAPEALPAETVPLPEAVETPPEPPVEAEAEPEPEAEPAPAHAVVLPTFDLVRVEADGSLVIAGHAAPRSSVEVIAGSSVIGTVGASGSGDFVLVLDEPLRPGDYTILLRATGPDDVVALSQETAVVSIPERPDGQVLALVEQPGAPSRLITVPEAAPAPAPAEPAEEEAAAQEEPAEPEPAAQEEALAAVEEEAAAEPEPAVVEDEPLAAEGEPAVAEEEPAAEIAAIEEDEAEPQLPTVAAEPREPQPTVAAPAEAAPQEAITAEPAPERPAPVPAAPAPVIAVEAVEIEGRRIFVAGIADERKPVRVYANEHVLGETESSPTGRFLVEAERDLPVGEYLIRADLLALDRSTVIARAVVPFEREPGEQVAAVAPRAEPPRPVPAPRPTPVPQPAPPREAPSVQAEPAPPPAETVIAATPPSGPAAAAPSVGQEEEAAGIPETTGARLEPAEGSVIIRRGDTLWQISRRVYGRGVRYSTIYLANQDQISDPDRIWPGQIFAVPGETEEGEPADLSAIADREPTAEQ